MTIPTVEKNIFGTTCYAWVSNDTVEVNLTDWSGRLSLETVDKDLKTLKEFITELEAAVAARRAEKEQAAK